AILDNLQAGKAIDRGALVELYPKLAEQIDLLCELHGGAVTRTEASLPGATPILPQIGPYQGERELGVGGFGIVYLAFDAGLKRRVALKVLHPGRLTQPEVVLRFQREACVTARLRHPGIVQLFDYSREGPPHYLITEYVEGVDPCL